MAGIERRLKPIRPLDICHSKIAALERYAAFLSSEQFSLLCTLMRDLAPSLVYLVKPENAGKIHRGDARASRENLKLVINGDPNALPLFRD